MTEYITSQGDMVDLICWRYYGVQDNGILEQVLAANPGLADQGPVLPAGLTITLPDMAPTTQTPGVRLWG